MLTFIKNRLTPPFLKKSPIRLGVYGLTLCLFLLPMHAAFSAGKCSTKGPQHKPRVGEAPRMCFFSLNADAESIGLKQEMEKKGLVLSDKDEDDNTYCEKPNGEGKCLEVKEFFTEPEIGVRASFEKMTNSHCDTLSISGSHAGYFFGKKTSKYEGSDRGADNVGLKLDFLEQLSCLNKRSGADCKPWFSNIKALHLHGSRTAGHCPPTKGHTSKASSTSTFSNRIKEHGEAGWTPRGAEMFHREFASTMDKKNPLCGRYLRMFPQAQVFAFGKLAKSVDQDSANDFINMVLHQGQKHRGDKEVSSSDKILGYIDSLNVKSDPEGDYNCTDFNLFVTDDKPKGPQLLVIKDYHKSSEAKKIGCAFSNALMSGKRGRQVRALNGILCKSRKSCNKKKNIHQNLNRIIQSLNVSPNATTPAEKKADNTRIEALKKILRGSSDFEQVVLDNINAKELGLVRRVDYLSLAQKVGFKNIDKFQRAQNTLFEEIQEGLKASSSPVTQVMMIELVRKSEVFDEDEVQNTWETLKKQDAISAAAKGVMKDHIFIAQTQTKVQNQKKIDGKTTTRLKDIEGYLDGIAEPKNDESRQRAGMLAYELMKVDPSMATYFMRKLPKPSYMWQGFYQAVSNCLKAAGDCRRETLRDELHLSPSFANEVVGEFETLNL